jgi:hypothetical protein
MRVAEQQADRKAVDRGSPRAGPRHRRPDRWILAGLGLFAAGLALSVLQGLVLSDEAWFLQVVHRMSSGQVLYRDISFGVTPLSAYLTWGLTSVFGTQVLVVKAMVAACFAGTAILTWSVLRGLGLAVAPVLLALALLAYAFPAPGSPYAPLATTAFMGAFALTVTWWNGQRSGGGRPRHSAALAAAAGAAAGLSFGSKQNVGLLALAAVLLTMGLVRSSPGRWRGRILHAGLAVGGFLAVSALVLLPVWLSGGFPKLMEYGFLSKGMYLRQGGQSYGASLGRLWSQASHLSGPHGAAEAYRRLILLLPPVVLAGLAVAWARGTRGERRRVLLVAAFGGALVAAAYPRMDLLHLSFAAPAMFVALALGWRAVRPAVAAPWRRVGRGAVTAWLALGVGLLVALPAADLATGASVVSDFPHFAGPVIPATTADRAAREASGLHSIGIRGGPLFLLMSPAGFYYLVTGLENPTPFDFPLATTFGDHGKSLVARMIKAGRIRSVCESLPRGSLRPRVLTRFVKNHLRSVGEVGSCTLFLRT